MAERQVTAAEQEYLESLFWLYEAQLPMTGANLARAMQLSAPTVHEMLGRLERDGYIERTDGRKIQFTETGPRARRADRRPPPDDRALPHRRGRRAVGRRPRGGREARVRDDAALRGLHPHAPWATRPPARTAIPIKVGERIDGVPLADCEVGAAVTILRLENEAEDLLHYLKTAGIEPGLKGTVAANDGEEVQVSGDGSTASVTFSVAETVSVLADPSPPPRTALPEQLVLGGRYGR